MPRFRCGQCKNEFVAAKPSCVKCGLDPEQDVRHARFFIDLITIHFDPPSHIEGLGKGYAACNVNKKTGSEPGLAAWTSEKGVVNCEACKEADEFKADGPPPKPSNFAPIMSIAEREEAFRAAEEAARKLPPPEIHAP